MNKIVNLIAFTALLCMEGSLLFAQDAKVPIVIDETSKTESIIQTNKIDKVWAGQPVGFCLMTEGNNQYIAYYNAKRNLVLGQRFLDE